MSIVNMVGDITDMAAISVWFLSFPMGETGPSSLEHGER